MLYIYIYIKLNKITIVQYYVVYVTTRDVFRRRMSSRLKIKMSSGETTVGIYVIFINKNFLLKTIKSTRDEKLTNA